MTVGAVRCGLLGSRQLLARSRPMAIIAPSNDLESRPRMRPHRQQLKQRLSEHTITVETTLHILSMREEWHPLVHARQRQ